VTSADRVWSGEPTSRNATVGTQRSDRDGRIATVGTRRSHRNQKGQGAMSAIPRRDFLAAAAGAATVLGGAGRSARAEDRAEEAVPPPPMVPLGKTGVMLSRVGQGSGMSGGNRQSNHTRMGFERLVALFRHSYDRGVRFFDLADLYGTHVYFREALRTIPREKVAILTKLWWRYDGQPGSVPADFQRRGCEVALERFRHELTTDYLDIVLLHCLMEPNWPEALRPYMDALSRAKERKQVRAVGVSCHNLAALRVAASEPWVDVILARINPRGAKMDGKLDDVVPVLKEARKNGKAIIGMKIYGEGSLSNEKDACIQFAQENGLLDTMTVGAEKPEQMDETLRLIAKYPAKELI
jgi:aryl-alcohol dehydrogenase-like predicted oxidoreductase